MRRAAGVILAAGASILALIVAAELLLQWRSALIDRSGAGRTAIETAYRPFAVQHPHPYYLFFFPLDGAARMSLANSVCSIDADGFRDPGPAQAGGRQLAFVLGGSAAFGYYASSNAATITSRLNTLQDEYFFVNAGVPSWNSTQELMRVALDITTRRPALIVAFDGANDAVLAGQRNRHGAPYPPGTPEFFDELEDLAERDDTIWQHLGPARLLPEVSLRLDAWRGRDPAAADQDAGAVPYVPAASRRYLENHRRMAELAGASGARFVSVFQPVAGLHQRAGSGINRRPNIEAFHRFVVASPPSDYAFLDFSNVFDQDVSTVTIAGHQPGDDAVFADDVHLTDRGNALLAEHLWRALNTPPAPVDSRR